MIDCLFFFFFFKGSNLNAAACCLKLGNFNDAIKYSTDALKLDDFNVKALFRRSQGRRNIGEVHKAKEDIMRAIRLDAKNKALRGELTAVKKAINDLNKKDKALFGSIFSKPIYTDEPDVVFYDGPNPKVFFDISIGDEKAGRIVFELFMDKGICYYSLFII